MSKTDQVSAKKKGWQKWRERLKISTVFLNHMGRPTWSKISKPWKTLFWPKILLLFFIKTLSLSSQPSLPSSLANECSYNTAAYGEFELETSYSVDSDLACEFGGEESKCSDSKCRCDTAAAEALMNLKEDLIRIAELPATEWNFRF